MHRSIGFLKRSHVVLLAVGLLGIGGFFAFRADDDRDYPPASKSLTKKMRRSVFQLRVVFESSPANAVQNGSCVAINGKGCFLTVAHVVQRKEKRGQLPISEMRIAIDGRSHDATLVAVEPKLDLALIQLKSASQADGVSLIRLETDKPHNGQAAFLYGFPVRSSGASLLAEPTIASGRVTETKHKAASLSVPVIRVKASTHFGGSGGALINRDGRLLGIVVEAEFQKNSRTASHVLAVPAKTIKTWLEKVDQQRAMTDSGPPTDHPDPDGDGLTGPDDPHPWIADVPDVEIRPGRDVEFQLKTTNITLREQTSFSATQHTRRESIRSTHSDSTTDMDFVGAAKLRILNSEKPLFGIIGQLHLRQRSSRFVLDRARLKTVRKILTSRAKDIQATGANAWTLQIPIVVRNRSRTPCVLQNFELNVRVNGKLRWTKAATSADEPFRDWELTANGESTRLLRFSGLSRSEVEPLLRAGAPLRFDVEIPAASVKLRRNDDKQTRFPVSSVTKNCALLTVKTSAGADRRFVSVVHGRNQRGVSAETLLRRFAGHKRWIRWATGSDGDYLAEFLGKTGESVFLFGPNAHGRWILQFEAGQSTAAPVATETKDSRDRV
ncbi:MAG: trypsin-like peptidase domain-containing protein, partial [Planctomycetes bacterium]|nr:trypsin-like peptidase domain-containing protein [Planctomycetota bacterium]